MVDVFSSLGFFTSVETFQFQQQNILKPSISPKILVPFRDPRDNRSSWEKFILYFKCFPYRENESVLRRLRDSFMMADKEVKDPCEKSVSEQLQHSMPLIFCRMPQVEIIEFIPFTNTWVNINATAP